MKIKQILGLGSKILKAKLFNSSIPIKVTFHITYRCNLKCPFCFRRMKHTPEMDTPQIKKMMREFQAMGAHYWVFNGGEPLLRPDLGELIAYAKELNFYTSLVTNGMLLAERLKKEASFRQLDFVQLSLEGPQDVHDKMYAPGTYERVIRVLNLLQKLRIKTNILSLIARENIGHFDELMRLARQYRITLAFQPVAVQSEDNAGFSRRYFPDRQSFKKAVIRLIEQKKAGAPIFSSFRYLGMLKDYWPDMPHKIRCYAGQLYCSVTPDGYIVPCCAQLAQTQTKNLGPKVGFKKAFGQLERMCECRDCYYFGPQELNILLGIMPLNIFRIYKDIITKKMF